MRQRPVKVSFAGDAHLDFYLLVGIIAESFFGYRLRISVSGVFYAFLLCSQEGQRLLFVNVGVCVSRIWLTVSMK